MMFGNLVWFIEKFWDVIMMVDKGYLYEDTVEMFGESFRTKLEYLKYCELITEGTLDDDEKKKFYSPTYRLKNIVEQLKSLNGRIGNLLR